MSYLRKVILALILGPMLCTAVHAQGKVATIDLRKVFDNYWKTKQADAALKDRAADMEKEHKNMLDDWKKAKDDYQTILADANNQALSADERDRRKKSAEDKLKFIKDTEDSISQYERQARSTLDEQKRRMRDNILGEIRNVLNALAKSNSYAMVVDTAAESANNTPILLYTDNSNDLTDKVLSQLNAGAPADTGAVSKTEDKPADKPADKKDTKKK
jgi:outer membrane protein